MEASHVHACHICGVTVPMTVTFTLAEWWDEDDIYEIGGLRWKGAAEQTDLFAHLCTHEGQEVA